MYPPLLRCQLALVVPRPGHRSAHGVSRCCFASRAPRSMYLKLFRATSQRQNSARFGFAERHKGQGQHRTAQSSFAYSEHIASTLHSRLRFKGLVLLITLCPRRTMLGAGAGAAPWLVAPSSHHPRSARFALPSSASARLWHRHLVSATFSTPVRSVRMFTLLLASKHSLESSARRVRRLARCHPFAAAHFCLLGTHQVCAICVSALEV